MTRVLVGLGSNLGDRAATIEAAVAQLAATAGITLVATSSLIETQPVSPTEQPPYLNGAALLETSLPAAAVLALLQQIEQAFGRQRLQRWGPRTLDLDLLLYGTEQIETEQLIVPHRFLPFRRFVLTGACEIAADMIHPHLGWTLAQCLTHLSTTPPIYEVWMLDQSRLDPALGLTLPLLPSDLWLLRDWSHTKLIAWDAAPAPKARFVLLPDPDTLGSNTLAAADESVSLVELVVYLGTLPRVPELWLAEDAKTALHELLGAIDGMAMD
jgi:2-amino-4-hydroxy-6-hydroxymethyldihydropteridine diphosphokinase